MAPVRLRKPAAIVTDIEGSITSVRFWQDVLAPFVLDNVTSCLGEWWHRAECDDVIQLMRLNAHERWAEKNEHQMPLIYGEEEPRGKIIDSVERNLRYQLAKKKNSTQVKSIVLLVWLYGYQTEKLKGHVYQDVAIAFKKWHQHKIKLCTFASGYRLAQEMLLSRTLHGNLRSFVYAFFDADHQGQKDDPASYRDIARQIKESRANILFLSDSIQELEAAEKAGFVAVLVIRSHNQELKQQKDLHFKLIERFTDLEFLTDK